LIISQHHIITDAQSVDILVEEIAASYAARVTGETARLPPVSVHYGDFAVWQRCVWREDGAKLRSALTWWNGQIRPGLKPTQIPFRQLNAARGATLPSDWSIRWGLPRATSKSLDEIGHAASATYYMVRLAGLLPVLAALTSRDEAIIGGVFTFRNRLAVDRMLGCLSDLVVIALALDWQMSYRDFVRRVRDHVSAVQAHAGLPFERLAEAMASRGIELSSPPVVAHVRTPHPPIRVGDLRFTAKPAAQPFPRGIVVGFDQFSEADNCYVDFDSRLFERGAIERLVSSLVGFFNTAAVDPLVPLGELIDRAAIKRF
jgi:hypothetical protein